MDLASGSPGDSLQHMIEATHSAHPEYGGSKKATSPLFSCPATVSASPTTPRPVACANLGQMLLQGRPHVRANILPPRPEKETVHLSSLAEKVALCDQEQRSIQLAAQISAASATLRMGPSSGRLLLSASKISACFGEK